jgi:DNA-binding response OmpR family regulator
MKKNYNLLVVEYDPFVRTILRQTLRKDFSVVTQSNSLEAIEWLDSNNVTDLIITGLKMPHFNGLDFIRLVRSSPRLRTIPIFVLSEISDIQTRISCLETGADDFILKPFSPAEIRARAMAYMRRASLINAEARSKTGPSTFAF